MKIKHALCVICLAALMITSCGENDSPVGTGSIVIEFDSRVGNDDLELNTEYTNASDEKFTLTKFNYYISNIRLTKTNGNEYVVPQDRSYFLIMENENESQEVELTGVPAGDYNKITFTIGVDSLRSTMDISKRTGVLDPAQGHDGMYWTWHSGYIFFKMEGTSPSAPDDQEHKFYYHIGGYGGYDAPGLNNIRETTVSMGDARALVRSNKRPEVHLHVDVLEVFKNPTTIKIEEHSLVMFSDYSRNVSENYVNMFKYDHVHN
jgi:hypothetical protein